MSDAKLRIMDKGDNSEKNEGLNNEKGKIVSSLMFANSTISQILNLNIVLTTNKPAELIEGLNQKRNFISDGEADDYQNKKAS